MLSVVFFSEYKVNEVITYVFRKVEIAMEANPFLIFYVIVQTAVCIILALGLKGETMSTYLGWIAVVMICVYVSSFAWSWGPLGWLIPSEIYPLDTRSAGQAITVSTNMFFTFVIAQVFLSLLCAFKWGIFLFFAAWVLVMMVFTYWFIPETKGIPIEEMELLWTEHWFWKRFVPALETPRPMTEMKVSNLEKGTNKY